MSYPHWSHWISYETSTMSRIELTTIIVESYEKLLNYKKRFRRITEKEYWREKFFIDLEKIFIKEFDEIMRIEDLKERKIRLEEISAISKDPLLASFHILTQKKKQNRRLE